MSLKELSLNRYIKFLVVGAIGTGINYGVFYVLRSRIPLDIAWLSGIVVSATSNYVLNEGWTFK